MGNCFELCCSRGYEPVPDAEESIARSQSALDTAAVLHEKGPNGYKTVEASMGNKRVGASNPALVEFDQYSSVFSGAEVLQKFHNSSQYSKRFVWLNAVSNTIHMSQHMSKDRRHKEASLADVTSVVAGPPAKRRAPVEGEDEKALMRKCLTINFRKGGGIDLQFSSEKERDDWHAALSKIIMQLKPKADGNQPK